MIVLLVLLIHVDYMYIYFNIHVVINIILLFRLITILVCSTGTCIFSL